MSGVDLFKDWMPSINEKKLDIFRDTGFDQDSLEKDYPSFMINRALSQTMDTVQLANVVNVRADFMSAKMQYDFLMNTVSKKKRFAKWAKAESSDRIDLIKKTFSFSQKKAEIVSDLIDDDAIKALEEWNFEGGRK